MSPAPTLLLRRSVVGLAVIVLVVATGAGLRRAQMDPSSETTTAQIQAVESTLRCPTCQGLSVADSPSPIAAEMRRIVVRQVAAGRSPQQIRGYFTARYGDWILLSPPLAGIGWVVWLAPAAVLVVGVGGLGWFLRRRSRVPAGADATPAQLLAVEEALNRHRADTDFGRAD